jgi:hypothetical protein
MDIFLFATASRPALRPNRPPIQRLLGALTPVVNRPGREADHSPPSSAECVELYLHSPSTPTWRGAYLSIATTVPLNFYLCYDIPMESLIQGNDTQFNCSLLTL